MIRLPKKGLGAGCSLHNHSTRSDGADSLEAMCEAAKSAGLKVFGMSDHWEMSPFPEGVDWSMPLDGLEDYVISMQKIRSKLEDGNFRLLIGLEVGFFFETFEENRKFLEKFPLDYAIGSSHYAGDFPIDHDSADWVDIGQQKVDEIWDLYWKRMLGAAQSGFFTFLGHLDLPKKFGYKPSQDQFPRALEVLEAASRNGTGIEINTAGLYKPCQEQYPSERILQEVRRLGIPTVVSADAHSVNHVARSLSQFAGFDNTL